MCSHLTPQQIQQIKELINMVLDEQEKVPETWEDLSVLDLLKKANSYQKR